MENCLLKLENDTLGGLKWYPAGLPRKPQKPSPSAPDPRGCTAGVLVRCAGHFRSPAQIQKNPKFSHLPPRARPWDNGNKVKTPKISSQHLSHDLPSLGWSVEIHLSRFLNTSRIIYKISWEPGPKTIFSSTPLARCAKLQVESRILKPDIFRHLPHNLPAYAMRMESWSLTFLDTSHTIW